MRSLLLLVCLLVPVSASAQTTATPLDSIRLDYRDADVATYQVTNFRICFDATAPDTACQNVALTDKFTPTAAQGGAPATGFSAYRKALPALTPGAHTATIKACNLQGCSTDANPTLSFTFQIAVPPPTNVQFIKG